MVIRRIGPLSVAKIVGIIYAALGLIFGAILSVVALVAGGFAGGEGGFGSMLFGAGAILVLPIFYGVLGFLMALIVAGVYNAVAGWIGGIEIDVQ